MKVFAVLCFALAARTVLAHEVALNSALQMTLAAPDETSVFPKTSADWAAWVQAVGSLAAVAAAFLVSYVQLRTQRRQREQEDALRQRRNLNAAHSFGDGVVQELASLINILESEGAPDIMRKRYAFADLIERARSLDEFGLEPKHVLAVLSLRAIASQATAIVDLIVAKGLGAVWPYVRDDLPRMMVDAEANQKRVWAPPATKAPNAWYARLRLWLRRRLTPA